MTSKVLPSNETRNGEIPILIVRTNIQADIHTGVMRYAATTIKII